MNTSWFDVQFLRAGQVKDWNIKPILREEGTQVSLAQVTFAKLIEISENLK